MVPKYYKQYAEIEDDLWWHRARCSLLDLCLAKTGLPAEACILDVGCGTGATTAHLCKHGSVTGVDSFADAVAIAQSKAPRARIISGDANELPAQFSAGHFDLVTLLHVLYHDWIKDEHKVLGDIHSLLKPGGILLLTEPAFPVLRRRQDRLSMGHRRYRIPRLRRLLAQAGFVDCPVCCYFNSPSFLPALLLALFAKARRRDTSLGEDEPLAEVSIPPKWLNESACCLMRLEALWIRWVGFLPFGVSIVCAARKAAAAD